MAMLNNQRVNWKHILCTTRHTASHAQDRPFSPIAITSQVYSSPYGEIIGRIGSI